MRRTNGVAMAVALVLIGAVLGSAVMTAKYAFAQTALEVTDAERLLVQNFVHSNAGKLIDVLVESGNQAIWDRLLNAAKAQYQKRVVVSLVDMADELGVPRGATIQDLADAIGYDKQEP